MNVSGKITLFPKMRGKFKFFEGSISQKVDDDYIKCSVECKFGNKDKFDEKFLDGLKVDNYYQIDITRGFLSVDEWEDKATHDTRKKLVIVIQSCDVLESGALAKKKAKK